mmetsp:Transcript_24297/g.51679  ORF Transcript_24297/g.51679 Transcript_24297/m.51679 type:complete len:283 (+) Transcript_24297:697-1545(+)
MRFQPERDHPPEPKQGRQTTLFGIVEALRNRRFVDHSPHPRGIGLEERLHLRAPDRQAPLCAGRVRRRGPQQHLDDEDLGHGRRSGSIPRHLPRRTSHAVHAGELWRTGAPRREPGRCLLEVFDCQRLRSVFFVGRKQRCRRNSEAARCRAVRHPCQASHRAWRRRGRWERPAAATADRIVYRSQGKGRVWLRLYPGSAAAADAEARVAPRFCDVQQQALTNTKSLRSISLYRILPLEHQTLYTPNPVARTFIKLTIIFSITKNYERSHKQTTKDHHWLVDW